MIRKLIIAGGLVALLVGAIATATPAAATTARAALFPAIGTYLPSAGTHMGDETVQADVVTINPSGLPRFEVWLSYTNDTSSVQTLTCALTSGQVKTASDTWLTINGTVTLKGIGSTCSEQPGYKDVLAPGQTGTFFTAFLLPPALGTSVQLSSLFSSSSGSTVRYYTAPFNPYAASTAGLLVVALHGSLGRAIEKILNTRDIYNDGKELWDTIRGAGAFGFEESINILDVQLLDPWEACPDTACVIHTLGSHPYVPELVHA
jgi:hypothetical protein